MGKGFQVHKEWEVHPGLAVKAAKALKAHQIKERAIPNTLCNAFWHCLNIR